MTDDRFEFVTHPATTEDCEPHTPSPAGYADHAEWAGEMVRTHTARRCRGCMRFLIWEPRKAVTCPRCLDEGHVCEDHPDKPWEGIWGSTDGHEEHGGIGMPCPRCCPEIPQDGRHSIAEAFVPSERLTP